MAATSLQSPAWAPTMVGHSMTSDVSVAKHQNDSRLCPDMARALVPLADTECELRQRHYRSEVPTPGANRVVVQGRNWLMAPLHTCRVSTWRASRNLPRQPLCNGANCWIRCPAQCSCMDLSLIWAISETKLFRSSSCHTAQYVQVMFY